MYEANPLAFIAEQAGGSASSGKERILDIQPQRLHQRTALIIGNKDVVERTLSVMNKDWSPSDWFCLKFRHLIFHTPVFPFSSINLRKPQMVLNEPYSASFQKSWKFLVRTRRYLDEFSIRHCFKWKFPFLDDSSVCPVFVRLFWDFRKRLNGSFDWLQIL